MSHNVSKNRASIKKQVTYWKLISLFANRQFHDNSLLIVDTKFQAYKLSLLKAKSWLFPNFERTIMESDNLSQ